MDNETTIRDETTIIASDRMVAISTVGYMCIAITWWMLGMLMAGWFTIPTIPGIASGVVYALGSILLVIVGILAIVYARNILDGIIFLGMAGLLFSLHLAHIAGLAGEANMAGYYGWYAFVWAIFFCYLWIAAMSREKRSIRMLFLLLFWVGALISAIGGWTTSSGLETISGYLFLGSAVLAFIASADAVLAGIKDNSRVEEKVTITSSPPPSV